MWILLAAVAWAGPPFQACAANDAGQIAFVRPKTGELYTLDGDKASAPLAKVPMPGHGYHHVVFPADGGGWWVGIDPVHHVKPDGSVSRAADPNPIPMFDALKGKRGSTRVGQAVYFVQSDDLGGTVYRTDGGVNQTTLWRFDHWSKAPLGLFARGEELWGVGHGQVFHYTGTTPPAELPLPATTTVGVCAADKGPLHAVTIKGRDDTTCVHRLEAESWKELFCLE